jgi:hypothetical protein
MPIINHEIRQHQRETEWRYRSVTDQFWDFYDYFRDEHFPDVQDCIVCVRPININSAMKYQTGDNQFGAEFECTLNSKWFNLPKYFLAAYALHTAIHIWQEYRGAHSGCGAHNREFLDKAQLLGIPACGSKTCKVVGKIEEAFIRRIIRLDTNVEDQIVPGTPRPRPYVPSTRYHRCGCMLHKVSLDSDLTCNKCGKLLELEDPKRRRIDI